MFSSLYKFDPRSTQRWIAFFVIWSVAPWVLAMEGNSGTAPPSLSRLADEPFSIRRQTTHQLWQDRDRFRELVHAAARGTDAELAERARWVLHRWQRGILTQTPPELARQLSQLPPEKAIELLLENGQFDAAVIAIEESAGTIEQDAIATKLTASLDDRFSIYVEIGQRLGNLDRLLGFLDRCCETKQVAICRFDLMRRLEIPIDETNLLPPRAATWSAIQRSETLCLLHCLRGNSEQAIKIAEKHEDAPERARLLREIRLASFRWRELADDSVATAQQLAERPLLPGEDEVSRRLKWIRLISDSLIAAERMEDDGLVDRLLAELKQMPRLEAEASDRVAQAESLMVESLRWRCLVRYGQVDEALEILKALDVSDAARVASEVGRIEDALNLLGCPIDQIDSDLERWIDEAVKEQIDFEPEDARRNQLVPSLQRMLTLMEILAKIGRNDQSLAIARRLCQPGLTAGQVHVRDFVVILFMRTHEDWAFELALMPGQTEPDELTLRYLAEGLSIDDPRIVPALSRLILLEEPDSNARDRFVRACRMVQSKVSDVETNSMWLSALSRRLSDGSLESSLSDRSLGEVWSMPPLETWVSFFELNGRSDLVKGWLPISTREMNFEDELDFDNQEVPFEEIEAAMQQYQTAIRIGDESQATEIRERLMLIACSPSLSVRQWLAEKLAEVELIEEADQLYRDLVIIALMTKDESTTLNSVTGNYYSFAVEHLAPPEADPQVWEAVPAVSDSVNHDALDRHEAILGWRELSFDLGLAWGQWDATTYVILPSFITRHRLEIMTERLLDPAMRIPQTAQQVKRLVDRGLRWNPIDINLAESVLPRLRSRGQAMIADPAFESVFSVGREYLRVCWQDSMTANNLAWSAAMNERYADEALELARLAVRVEPDSAIYRDTLAELLYRSGEVKQALQIEQACLVDDPGQWHLHQQIQRFQSTLLSSSSSSSQP